MCETAECAQILLDAGAKLDAVDHEGKTPYHFAAEERRGEMVDFLKAALTARGLPVPEVEDEDDEEEEDDDETDEEDGEGEGLQVAA